LVVARSEKRPEIEQAIQDHKGEGQLLEELLRLHRRRNPLK